MYETLLLHLNTQHAFASAEMGYIQVGTLFEQSLPLIEHFP